MRNVICTAPTGQQPTLQARQFVECWKRASERAPYGEIDRFLAGGGDGGVDRHHFRSPAACLSGASSVMDPWVTAVTRFGV